MQSPRDRTSHADLASPPHYSVLADTPIAARSGHQSQRPEPPVRRGTEQIGMQAGCSSLRDRDAAPRCPECGVGAVVNGGRCVECRGEGMLP